MATAIQRPKKPLTVNHGGKLLTVPNLTEPVGKATPTVLGRYPKMNQPTDVATVDYYLSRFEALRAFKGSPTVTEIGVARLLGAVGAVPSWSDRTAAIASLQASFGVRDKEEVADCLIKPRGNTLIELVDNGDIAEKLLAAGAPGQRDPREYIYVGRFDRAAFRDAYLKEFSTVKKANPSSFPALVTLLGFIEDDPSVLDIRWMAYLLGTALIEASETTLIPGTGKKKLSRVWRNFNPIEERGHGAGLKYYLPVKVTRLRSGTAHIIEQDGDEFAVDLEGKWSSVGNTPGKVGAPANGTSAASYNADRGTPLNYFGRGYVQLTWWYNYATAGVLLGRELDFLFNPALVMDPAIAYQLMSYCMRTGKGFANGHKLSQYFFSGFTDYLGARDMVNAHGDHKEVADAAQRFERTLLASKFQPTLMALQ
jgi:hypothetical protein